MVQRPVSGAPRNEGEMMGLGSGTGGVWVARAGGRRERKRKRERGMGRMRMLVGWSGGWRRSCWRGVVRVGGKWWGGLEGKGGRTLRKSRVIELAGGSSRCSL